MDTYPNWTAHEPSEPPWRLFSEAGQVLTAPLDPTRQLANFAQVVVSLLADVCIVHLAEDGQLIRPLAVAHRNPQQLALTEGLAAALSPDSNTQRGVAQVLRTGQSEFYPEGSVDLLITSARDAEQLERTRALGLLSLMIVPLATQGRTLGTLTLAVAESGRRYVEADLALAEELARRAALVVDQARQSAQSQRRLAELDRCVLQRTDQVQATNTQLEISREQLTRWANHEQAVREEERTRLARDIHDQLGQDLTALKMDLAWLQRHTDPRQTNLLQKLQSMSDQLDTTVRSLRRIVTDLRPAILDDLGLLAAMEWQLQEFEKRTAIQCTLTSTLEAVALDGDCTSALFRIFQETLTNVSRHAAATRVEVSLDEIEGCVRLRVTDNGRGILDSQVDSSKSFGLLGIRERVLLRSGNFYIRGTPGLGTTVVIRLPMNPVS